MPPTALCSAIPARSFLCETAAVSMSQMREQELLSSLYRTYGGRVYSRCLYLLKNKEEAQDALHTALELQPGLHLAQVVLKELGPSSQSPVAASPGPQATPAAHFTIKHDPSVKDDGPWLPDLAE